MFNRRDKIIKKDGVKPTDLEEEVAKSLHQLELNNKNLKANLSIIFINAVNNVDYESEDGSAAQYLLVRIPHRSLQAYKKVGALVQEHLEQQYEKPVLIVANRTIISPSGKYFKIIVLIAVFCSQAPCLPDETKKQNPHCCPSRNFDRCCKYTLCSF
jgi:hypothetical protein